MPASIGQRDLLLVVDVQNDFMPGGPLAVPRGDEIIPLLNRLAARFPHVALTQDWHPQDHRSFASTHAGRAAFDTTDMPYGEQVLWPDHCVQGTPGAAFAPALSVPHAELVVRKGYRRAVDSYSAFCEADRRTRTGLAGYMRERGFERVYIAGLATDFCVAWSAVDARAAGFQAVVVDDACRPIDTGGSLVRSLARMNEAGVTRVESKTLLAGA